MLFLILPFLNLLSNIYDSLKNYLCWNFNLPCHLLRRGLFPLLALLSIILSTLTMLIFLIHLYIISLAFHLDFFNGTVRYHWILLIFRFILVELCLLSFLCGFGILLHFTLLCCLLLFFALIILFGGISIIFCIGWLPWFALLRLTLSLLWASFCTRGLRFILLRRCFLSGLLPYICLRVRDVFHFLVYSGFFWNISRTVLFTLHRFTD